MRATGDGGVHSTVADIRALWLALFAGAVVAPSWVAEMVRPRSDVPEHEMRYGLGFWLHATATTHTVIANTSAGAWPLTRHLDTALWGNPEPAEFVST